MPGWCGGQLRDKAPAATLSMGELEEDIEQLKEIVMKVMACAKNPNAHRGISLRFGNSSLLQ